LHCAKSNKLCRCYFNLQQENALAGDISSFLQPRLSLSASAADANKEDKDRDDDEKDEDEEGEGEEMDEDEDEDEDDEEDEEVDEVEENRSMLPPALGLTANESLPLANDLEASQAW
jgi:hypothetical protein